VDVSFLNNLIYLAGPITDGGKHSHLQTFRNIFNAMKIYGRLIRKGYTPILPHFSYFYHSMVSNEFTHDDWLRLDFNYIASCDHFLFIGPSKGSTKELEYATSLAKAVYYDIDNVPDYPKTFTTFGVGDV